MVPINNKNQVYHLFSESSLIHSSVGDLTFIKMVPHLHEKARQLIPRDVTMCQQQFTDRVAGSRVSTPFSNLCVMLDSSIE